MLDGFGGRGRKAKREDRSSVKATHDLDGASMKLQNPLRDGKSQACSVGSVIRVPFTSPVEPIEDVREVGFGNAATRILDSHSDAILFGCQ